MASRLNNDYERMTKADELLTEALEALEESNCDKAIILIEEALENSFSIEQRLALLLLKGLITITKRLIQL